MMHGAFGSILLALIPSCSPEKLFDNFDKKVIHHLVDRVPNTWPLPHTDLDDTVFAKTHADHSFLTPYARPSFLGSLALSRIPRTLPIAFDTRSRGKKIYPGQKPWGGRNDAKVIEVLHWSNLNYLDASDDKPFDGEIRPPQGKFDKKGRSTWVDEQLQKVAAGLVRADVDFLKQCNEELAHAEANALTLILPKDKARFSHNVRQQQLQVLSAVQRTRMEEKEIKRKAREAERTREMLERRRDGKKEKFPSVFDKEHPRNKRKQAAEAINP